MRRLCLVLALASCLLVGCGFHLRGSVNMPAGVEPFYISAANAQDTVYLELRNIFNTNDLELTKNPKKANYQLIISRQSQDRRTTSVGNDGRAAQYQLIETVIFSLQDSRGNIASGPSELTERRTLQNDPNRVISTESEERLIREEMKKSLARKITRQISNFNYQAYEEQQAAEARNAPAQ